MSGMETPGAGTSVPESGAGSKKGFINKRREKVVAEIQRNQRGEYKVPTWVLVAILVTIVGGVAALIIFVG